MLSLLPKLGLDLVAFSLSEDSSPRYCVENEKYKPDSQMIRGFTTCGNIYIVRHLWL